MTSSPRRLIASLHHDGQCLMIRVHVGNHEPVFVYTGAGFGADKAAAACKAAGLWESTPSGQEGVASGYALWNTQEARVATPEDLRAVIVAVSEQFGNDGEPLPALRRSQSSLINLEPPLANLSPIEAAWWTHVLVERLADAARAAEHPWVPGLIVPFVRHELIIDRTLNEIWERRPDLLDNDEEPAQATAGGNVGAARADSPVFFAPAVDPGCESPLCDEDAVLDALECGVEPTRFGRCRYRIDEQDVSVPAQLGVALGDYPQTISGVARYCEGTLDCLQFDALLQGRSDDGRHVVYQIEAAY